MFSVFWFLSFLAFTVAQCPPKYSLTLDVNNTVCYSFHLKLTKFYGAQSHCKSFGGQLVSLKTAYINTFISGFANSIFYDVVFFWSGGNSLHDSKEFTWSDGEKLTYTHFPRDVVFKNGSCLSADIRQGFWRADNCFAEFSYVCEFLAGKGITPTDAADLDPQVDPTTQEPPSQNITTTTNPPETTTTPKDDHESSPPPSDTTTTTNPPEIPTTSDNESSPPPPSDTTTTIDPSKIPTTQKETTESPTAEPTLTCPTGYALYGKNCYKFSTEKKTWNDAESECKKEKGHLASIHSEEENKHIADAYISLEAESKDQSCHQNTIKNQVWIGYNNISNPSYAWSDDSATDYTNWCKNEPNNLRQKESCGTLVLDGVCLKNCFLHWNDFPCQQKLIFVCKQAATESGGETTSPSPKEETTSHGGPTEETPISTTESPQSCPADYVLYEKNCYKYNTEKKSWDDAESDCQKDGGHLASIHSEEENKLIADKYISLGGLTDGSECYFSNQVWIGFTNVSHPYAWSDNSPADYINWCNSEPNNFYKNESCGVIVLDDCFPGCAYRWNDFGCNQKLQYICKQPAKDTSKPAVITDHCPSGWKYHSVSGRCYSVSQKRKTWRDAEAECQMADSHLISIDDEAENQFIVDLLKENFPGQNCNTSLQTWLGLSKLAEDNSTWLWIDGNDTNFTKWSKTYSQPNNHGGNQYCVEIIASDGCIFKSGEWNDVDCNFEQNFICEKPAKEALPEPTPGTDSPCLPDMEYNNVTKSCYQLKKLEVTWEKAEEECQKKSGHLVSIHDENENNFVLNLAQSQYNHSKCQKAYQLWIGFTRIGGDNKTYHWSDKSPSKYSHWAARQPDQKDGKEACANIHTSAECHFKLGEWNDLKCETTRYFVCKYPAITPR